MKIRIISITFCLMFSLLSLGDSKNFAKDTVVELASTDVFCFLLIEESPLKQMPNEAICGGFSITGSGCTDGIPDCTIQGVYCILGNQIQINLASSCGW